MNKNIIYFAIFFLSTNSLFAQNVSVDNNCLNINSAMFGETLIQLKGESFVSKLLDENQSFLLFINVDSVGIVRSVERVKSKININDDFVKEVSSFIIEKEMHFYNCFEKPIGYSDNEAIEMLEKYQIPNNRGLYLINIAFPGELMILYNYKKDELLKQGINLSKIEYLKLQIAKSIN